MIKRRSIDILFAAIVAVTLLFGIKPKGFRLYNKAVWTTTPSPGLAFRRPSVAHTRKPLGPALAHASAITFEILYTSGWRSSRYTAWIAGIEGLRGSDLWIGAWRHCLMVNGQTPGGNDAHAGACRKKSSITDTKPPVHARAEPVRLTATMSGKGTWIYLDGRLKGAYPGRVLMPESPGSLGRLVVGSAPEGSSSWIGTIHELAIYDTILLPGAGAAYARIRRPEPIVRYRFDSGRERISSAGAAPIDLHIPRIHTAVRPRLFNPPWRDFKLKRGYAADMIINLFGFIPFGLAAFAWFRVRFGFSAAHALLLASLGGFAFSFAIELTQAFMPTRSSQLIDLILNAVGAALGAVSGWVAAGRGKGFL